MYRQKRSYRRKMPSRKRYYKKSNNYINLAKKAFKTAKWVAGLVNAEYKYIDTNFVAAPIDYNGAINTSLCTPSQGVGASQREGDSIKVKNVTLRGAWKYNGEDTVCRLIVLWDPDNTISGVADFLDTTGSTMSVYANRNQTFKFNAKTLYDKTYSLTADNALKQFKFVLKIGKHTQFTPGGTNIAKGAIKLIVISQIGASTIPEFEYSVHATYIDN